MTDSTEDKDFIRCKVTVSEGDWPIMDIQADYVAYTYIKGFFNNCKQMHLWMDECFTLGYYATGRDCINVQQSDGIVENCIVLFDNKNEWMIFVPASEDLFKVIYNFMSFTLDKIKEVFDGTFIYPIKLGRDEGADWSDYDSMYDKPIDFRPFRQGKQGKYDILSQEEIDTLLNAICSINDGDDDVNIDVDNGFTPPKAADNVEIDKDTIEAVNAFWEGFKG